MKKKLHSLIQALRILYYQVCVRKDTIKPHSQYINMSDTHKSIHSNRPDTPQSSIVTIYDDVIIFNSKIIFIQLY